MSDRHRTFKKLWLKLLQLIERIDLFLKLTNKDNINAYRQTCELEGKQMQPKVLNSELVDEEVLQQMIKDTDAEIIPMLIDHYFEESQQRLERINKAVSEFDKETLEFEVHTLGSTALALGNRTLSNLARKIEHLCLDNQQDEAFSLHVELQSLAQRSLAALIERKELGF